MRGNSFEMFNQPSVEGGATACFIDDKLLDFELTPTIRWFGTTHVPYECDFPSELIKKEK